VNAEQLAREIADDLDQYIDWQKIGIIERIIAARLAPLVSDAEKYHKLMEINDRMQKCFGNDD